MPHNKPYAIAIRDNNTAEITMYGEVVRERPRNYYGEPAEGDYIVAAEFISDLNTLVQCHEIIIRMDSIGGDARASFLIHNRLRELAGFGISLVCIVDGVAMSGGSIIQCACDTVKVNPSSIIMIHKCIEFLYGYYNADEMRAEADACDPYDRSMVAVYRRKCGLEDDEILSMMEKTTYLNGAEAIAKGFADELIDNASELDLSASDDRRSIYVRGRRMRLCACAVVPQNIPTATAEQAAAYKEPERGSRMTKEELRAAYPTEIAEIEADVAAGNQTSSTAAVAQERERIRCIDEIASLYPDDVVNAAKYGNNACTAQELAYRAALDAKKKGKGFLAALEEDGRTSGTENVGAVPPTDDERKASTPSEKLNESRAAVKAVLHGEAN